MPRMADIDPEQLDPGQRRVWDAIVSGPRGVVEGPLRVWLASPEFAIRAQALGAFCRFGSSLPARLSELAILVTGAYWKAGFEWHAHVPIACKAGLAEDIIAAIHQGRTPVFAQDDEAVVHAFATELVQSRRVCEATYRGAVKILGERGVVDLVGILGYYALISMTIVAFEVPLPAGEAEPFADGGAKIDRTP